MKCADCKRALTKPALTIGAYVFGPICAKRYGVAQPKQLATARQARKPVPVDPDQLALDLETD